MECRYTNNFLGDLHINISGCEKMKLKVKIRMSGTIRKHPIIFTTTQRDTYIHVQCCA